MTDPLQLFPAIDIRDGRCVRLLRGDYDAQTVYGDPVDQARSYLEDGAKALHLVDLDAARTGIRANRDVIAAILSVVGVPVQVGGGVRTDGAAEDLLSGGASRVVLGTAGIEDPALTRRLAQRYPNQIVLGLDHRVVVAEGVTRREVAVRGWESSSGIELLDAIDSVADLPLAGLVITEISRDGTLSGPDLEGYATVLAATDHPVIASGGVGQAAHLSALAGLEADGRVLAGVIVGRALLGGELTLSEALIACAR